MPTESYEVREKTVEFRGKFLRVQYRNLSWIQSSDAADAAWNFQTNQPYPAKIGNERLRRMLVALQDEPDGPMVPFDPMQMLAWPEDFGAIMIKEIAGGVMAEQRLAEQEAFRRAVEPPSQGQPTKGE